MALEAKIEKYKMKYTMKCDSFHYISLGLQLNH